MKYYEIFPTHTETPRDATHKVANLYIEFNYHFLTLQKKIPLLLNRSVQQNIHYHSWETDEDQIEMFDKMTFEIYKLFELVEPANCKHTNVILDICHHYIHSCLFL